jgi:hypothetical protein
MSAVGGPTATGVPSRATPDDPREHIAGRCGAKIANRPGEVCQELPVPGRRRCGRHGGLTPTGRASPHYRHGRDSRYSIPLDSEEEIRYEDYRRQVGDATDDIALARIQRDRAMAGGADGVKEHNTIASLMRAHLLATKGLTVRHVADEASVTRMMDALLPIIERRVDEGLERHWGGREVRALIAQDAQALDWKELIGGGPPAPPASG